jgi:hypothetical protein
METLSAFVSCETVGYVTSDELDRLRQLAHSALRSLNGYIRYVRKQQRGQKEYGNQAIWELQPIYITIPDLSTDD